MWEPMGGIPMSMNAQTMKIDSVDPPGVKRIHMGDQVDLAAMPFRDRGYLYENVWLPPGFTIPVKIARGGSTRTVAVAAIPEPQPIDEAFAAFSRKIVALIYAMVAVILVWRRPNLMLWGLALFLLRTHTYWIADLVSPPIAAIIVLTYSITDGLGWAGLIVFAARFPDNRTTRATKFFDLIAVALFLRYLVLDIYPFVTLFTARPISDLPDWIGYRCTEVAVVAIFVSLCWKSFRSKWRSQWRGFRWVVAGYGVSVIVAWETLPQLFDYFSNSVEFQYAWWPVVGQQVLLLALPASVAYAIIRHRAFSLGYLANRTIVYGAFGVGAASAIVISVWVASKSTSTIGIGLSMFAALLAGMTFRSSRAFVVRFVDRSFLRRRYEAALSLDALRDSLRGSNDAIRMTNEVAETLGLSSLAVFSRAADGGFVRNAAFGWPPGSAWHLLPEEPLMRTLEDGGSTLVRVPEDEAELALPEADARPQFALALRRGDRIERAIFVGPQRNGASLDRDAMRSLHGVFAEASFA